MPVGIRQDTRKHTRHFLRPDAEDVAAFLADPTDAAWRRFAEKYCKTLADRFEADRAPFDELAALASEADVYLGCSCPTAKNPDVEHCHTVLALRFFKQRYRKLKVVLPG